MARTLQSFRSVRPLLAIAFVALVACDGSGPADELDDGGGSTGGADEPLELRVTSVEHVLEWELDGAELDGDGQVRITNDLGVAFTLERGYLVTYSVSLVHCPEPMAWLPAVDDLLVPTAWANDGGTDDPTALPVPHVEDLTRPEPTTLDTLEVPGGTYCEAHYLVARGVPDATNLPDDPDMIGTTLWLSGSRIGGDGLVYDFSLRTNLADGVVLPLQDVSDGARDTGRIRLTTVRSLGHLLDGVDPDLDSELQMSRAVLTNLTDHTSVRVEAASE